MKKLVLLLVLTSGVALSQSTGQPDTLWVSYLRGFYHPGAVVIIDSLGAFIQYPNGTKHNLDSSGTAPDSVRATYKADRDGSGSVISSTYYKSGGTDVPVTDGGTGASTASGARTNLGLGTLATQNTVTTSNIANHYTSTVQTTSNTVTTLHTFTLTPGTNVRIYKIVVDVVSAASVSSHGAGYRVHGTYSVNGVGSVTLIGSVLADYTAESNSAWNCTLDISGSTVRVRVTGATFTDINWFMVDGWIEFQEAPDPT